MAREARMQQKNTVRMTKIQEKFMQRKMGFGIRQCHGFCAFLRRLQYERCVQIWRNSISLTLIVGTENSRTNFSNCLVRVIRDVDDNNNECVCLHIMPSQCAHAVEAKPIQIKYAKCEVKKKKIISHYTILIGWRNFVSILFCFSYFHFHFHFFFHFSQSCTLSHYGAAASKKTKVGRKVVFLLFFAPCIVSAWCVRLNAWCEAWRRLWLCLFMQRTVYFENKFS